MGRDRFRQVDHPWSLLTGQPSHVGQFQTSGEALFERWGTQQSVKTPSTNLWPPQAVHAQVTKFILNHKCTCLFWEPGGCCQAESRFQSWSQSIYLFLSVARRLIRHSGTEELGRANWDFPQWADGAESSEYQCLKRLGTLKMNLVFSFLLNLKQAVKDGGVAFGAKQASAKQAAASTWEHQWTFVKHLRNVNVLFLKLRYRRLKLNLEVINKNCRKLSKKSYQMIPK